jgi:hypothetical protein
MTGQELKSTPDQKLLEVIHRVRVFARVSPDHKLLIVRALQPIFRSDHVWTMPEVLWVIGLSVLPVPVVELSKLVMRPSERMRAGRNGPAPNVATSP